MSKRRTLVITSRFSRSQEKALLEMEKTALTAEAGNTNAGNLPTVSTGLTSGMIWNNAGVITVVA